MNSAAARLSLVLALLFFSYPALGQTTFPIGDSAVTVTNPPGLAAGDEILFQGQIITNDADGVRLTALPGQIRLTFTDGSIVRVIDTGGSSDEGISIGGDFNGDFSNAGLIESGGGEAIQFNNDFSGTFFNSGTIRSSVEESVHFEDGFDGFFLNTGNITSITNGGEEAVQVNDDFTGTFINRGTISAIDDEAILFDRAFTGSFLNTGLISSENDEAIEVDNDFDGSFINHGTISSIDDEAFHFQQAFTGSFLNTGLISSEDDGAVEVSNGFNGSFINRGTIASTDGEAVEFGNVFNGSFVNEGTILSSDNDAVVVQSGFTGSFLNSGTISGTTGIDLNQGFDGTFVNRGTILSTSQNAIDIQDVTANSTFTNSGSIRGDNNGIFVSGTNAGNWLNTGIIEGGNVMGFTAQTTTETTGTFTNRGGRITGNLAAIHLGNGNATLNLEGPSHIQGLMSGGDGAGDTIRFQNIRGISDAKRAELAALVGADPTVITSITLFGETLSFTEFESVQLDLASLQSYEDILRPGLGGYGTALDNVLQLNDEIRGFLSALNDADLDTLNKIAGTTSGQVIVSGLDDFVQHQDANLFSLFANEFSTLRRDPSGGGSVAANGRNGLFTREVQVGVTIQEPVDQAHVYVTGFVGNGSQDPDLVRSESSIDNTSILFGRTDHVSHEWMLGIWGGYVDNDATVDSFGSALRNEAGYVGVNASYLNDDLFANFLLGYGFHDQLSIRRDFRGGVHSGDAVGNQALFQAQVGRDLFFGNEGQTKVSPYLGFALSSLSMGGFIEDGPALTRLRFEAESTISAQSVLGVNISTLQETNHGWIKPKLDAAWWHEFAGADNYGVSLATPGFLNAFQVTSPVANRDRAVIQAGLEFGLDRWEGVSFDATYFGTFGGDGYSSHGGALSATFAF